MLVTLPVAADCAHDCSVSKLPTVLQGAIGVCTVAWQTAAASTSASSITALRSIRLRALAAADSRQLRLRMQQGARVTIAPR
jgi:hypothetical protein